MAKPRMDLSAFVGKLLEEQDGDVLREGIRVLSQALMETEVAGLIGADRHERTPERTGHSNGYRMRTWDTRVGTIELAIPKVRPGCAGGRARPHNGHSVNQRRENPANRSYRHQQQRK